MKAGVHAIIQKIGEDAQRHSDERCAQLKHDIDEEISRENALYQEKSDRRREMLMNHHAHEYERLLEQMNSRLHREMVVYQYELIYEIFDRALHKLRGISSTEFAALFKAAIRDVEGKFTLHIGELSKGKLSIQAIVDAVEEYGRHQIIVSDVTVPGKSGFLLKNDSVEYSCLFEDLIEDKKREQAAALLKKVFQDYEV